jgi:hypothetical protein
MSANRRRRHIVVLLLSLSLFFLAPPQPFSQEEGAAGGALEWGGYLLSDLHLGMGEDFSFSDSEFSRKELRLDLHIDSNPTDRVHIYAETWLRAWGFPETVSELSHLSSADVLVPLGLELREAYVDVYGFVFDFVDLRAGRQRIAWGTADKISIIDNMDSDDLEDPWDFGRHLPSDGLKLTFYFDPVTVQAVYVPIFRPARLAEDSPLLGEFPSGFQENLDFDLPQRDPVENAILGLRATAFVLGWDVSASYIYGRDDLPTATDVIGKLDLQPQLDITFDYLRQHIVGLDITGELFGLGLWAELAFFIPEQMTLATDMTALGQGREEEESELYVKGLVGLDYTFSNGIYVNLQYSRGFAYENTPDDLGNYLFFGFEWKLFDDQLLIGPIGIALEVDDFRDFSGTWAFVFNPEVSYYPVDAVRLSLGLRWIEGEDGTLFGLWKEQGEIYFEGQFSF